VHKPSPVSDFYIVFWGVAKITSLKVVENSDGFAIVTSTLNRWGFNGLAYVKGRNIGANKGKLCRMTVCGRQC
jgi:hypothetical protein